MTVCIPGANPNPPITSFQANCTEFSVEPATPENQLVLFVSENSAKFLVNAAITVKLLHNQKTIPGIDRYYFNNTQIDTQHAPHFSKYTDIRDQSADEREPLILYDFRNSFNFEDDSEFVFMLNLIDTCDEVEECGQSPLVSVNILSSIDTMNRLSIKLKMERSAS